MPDNLWKIGQVKFFNDDKGFGFVNCWDDGQDYFVHISKVYQGPITDNDYAVFKLAHSRNKPGTNEAAELSLLSKFQEAPEFLVEQFQKYQSDSLRKQILRILPVDDSLKIVEQELESIPEITNDEQYSNFKKKERQLNSMFENPVLKDGVQKIIIAWATQIASENFSVKLWLDGFIDEVPDFEEMEDCFHNSNENERVEIFYRLEKAERQKLLQDLVKNEEPKKVIDFILEYLRKKNNLGSYVDLKSKLNDSEYWAEKDDYEILKTTFELFENNLAGQKLFELFFGGYLPTFSVSYVLENFKELSQEQIESVFESDKLSVAKIHKLLSLLLNENCLDDFDPKQNYLTWLYSLARQSLKDKSFEKFDRDSVEIISEDSHYIIWEKGLSKNTPIIFFSNYLMNSENIQKSIDSWLIKGSLSKEEIISMLKQNIKQLEKIANRQQFYILFNHLESLSNFEIELSNTSTLIKTENLWFFKLANWISGSSIDFDFEEFKSRLVYLSPEHQIKFLKKIFWLKHTGKFDLTIEKLNQLTRIDFDIYKLNQQFHPDILLDISVDIVIEAIKSFQTQGKFLFDSDLLKIVLKDVSLNLKHKFQIYGLFEKCQGRYEAKFNWQRNGEISKLENGFQISFEYDSSLVAEVKKLPKRSYNTQTRNWFVPLDEEEAVNKFAKEFRFFIHKTDGNNYSNNTHLAEWKRTSIPNGIQFCEGSLSNLNDRLFNKPFWWCCNEKCFKNCEVDHTAENYQAEPDENTLKDDYLDMPF
jgi:cold shock CspA family protein